MALTGSAIAGAIASISGAAATIAPIISAGAGIAGIVNATSGGGSQRASLPQLQEAPRVPEYSAIQAVEKQNILRANQKRTKTILTNPLGDTSGTSVIKAKALVGKTGQ